MLQINTGEYFRDSFGNYETLTRNVAPVLQRDTLTGLNDPNRAVDLRVYHFRR